MIQQIGQNLESRWHYEHQLKAHKRHLKEISHRSKSTFRSSEHPKIVNVRKLSLEIEKQTQIERENFLLFLKIHSINERKPNFKGVRGPKSLNLSTRRKEADKIFNENFAYVKRFIEMPSVVSAEKHAKEFAKHQVYKKNISKINLHQRLIKLSSFINKPAGFSQFSGSVEEYRGNLRSNNQSKFTDIEDKEGNQVSLQRKNSEINLSVIAQKEEDRKERLEMYDYNISDDDNELYNDDKFEPDDNIVMESNDLIKN